MSTSDVLAVVGMTVVAVLAGALVATLIALTRTLRALRTSVDRLCDETMTLLDDAYEAVRGAAIEVDRVERLVTSAEKISDAVDGASRVAYRTLASPAVKAMAFGTGVSRAAKRLREGEHPVPARARSRRRRA
ncbi:MAG: hypothetical protein ACT4OX_12135 [Actinomycetota bacterium]